jgi:signal transduction histidine kinase
LWARLPRPLVDTAFAVAVTVFVVLTEASERRHGEHVPTIGLVLLAGLAPALAVRRRYPVVCLVLVGAIQVGLSATSTAVGANVPAELIAPYSVAAHAGRRSRLVMAGVVAGVLVVVALPVWSRAQARQDALALLIGGAGAWLLGTVMRSRRQEVGRLAEHADRLERERELLARQAVADERLRIARELHDVVAHNLSVLVVRAQAMQPIVVRDPDRARGLAVSIEETGREALTEMRQLLGVLRAEDDGDQPATSPPGPQPGLDRLDALMEQVREAGLPVTLTTDGGPRRLAPAADLSAYRIVQEALTNVLRHAGPARAEVAVRYLDDGLTIAIVDDGRGASARLNSNQLPGAGHGLVGMRERVALFGGELRAGPRLGGGFEVRARIPFERTESG